MRRSRKSRARRDTIYTDGRGRPIEKPRRADFRSDSEFVRAYHAYQDKIAAASNAGFREGWKRGMRRDYASRVSPKAGGRYQVYVYESFGRPSYKGTVRLARFDFDTYNLEKKLSRVGVYAPRGADRLKWSKTFERAHIYDSTGQIIVELQKKKS